MASENSIVVFYVTDKGRRLADAIALKHQGAVCLPYSGKAVKAHWTKGLRLVFIMAAGIVVRTIAPLAKDKRTDPAVIVADENGEHWVSLLSGHQGGANMLAREIAHLVGGQAVVTTGSDVNALPAIDLWAEEQGLIIEDWKQLPKAGTRLIDQKSLSLFSDVLLDLPKAFFVTEDVGAADIVVTNKKHLASATKGDAVVLRPRNLVAGIGCNSGTSTDEIADAVMGTLDEHNLSFLSLRGIATIDRKAGEPGLVGFAESYGLPLLAFSAHELNGVKGVALSEAALRATGAQAVAEPAALLATGNGRLVVPKAKSGNVTVAVAEEKAARRKQGETDGHAPVRKGAVYVVGTGPGNSAHMTPEALDALNRSDVIVGYGTYLDLIRRLIPDKTVVATGMAQEIDRCKRAIRLAEEGKTVAMVSGGDPGIYAMAGLVLELLMKENLSPDMRPAVHIIPGISALNACAARLGAPLMHDFASISLSDRLTPWETIEERLDAAARADFVIVLYNPRSRGRRSQIQKAQQIILRHRAPSTPVGVVRAAMREHEKVMISDLSHLPFDEIDMQTTVIVGNSKTVVWDNLMITPRGYENKEAW